jgi:hypothetical protein
MKQISTWLLTAALLFVSVNAYGIEMFVLKKSGESTTFDTKNLQKITFPAGGMTVSPKQGPEYLFNISEIRVISFKNISSTDDNSDSEIINLKVAPNPANERISITIPHIISGSWQLEIYSHSGFLIQEHRFNQTRQNFELSTGSLPAGAYFILLKSGNAVYTSHFIKL